jgi:hypothetical protein
MAFFMDKNLEQILETYNPDQKNIFFNLIRLGKEFCDQDRAESLKRFEEHLIELEKMKNERDRYHF